MNCVYARLGRFIKDLRNLKCRNQQELSECANINQSYLSRIERGRANPSFALVESLLRELGCELVPISLTIHERYPDLDVEKFLCMHLEIAEATIRTVQNHSD